MIPVTFKTDDARSINSWTGQELLSEEIYLQEYQNKLEISGERIDQFEIMLLKFLEKNVDKKEIKEKDC